MFEDISRELISYSSVFEKINSIGKYLVEGNLRLLLAQFGGIFDSDGRPVSEAVYRFELELIKERYAARKIIVDGNEIDVGYRSYYLDEALDGISRSDLEDLSRSKKTDGKIESIPGAIRYVRENISYQRSSAAIMVRAAELRRFEDCVDESGVYRHDGVHTFYVRLSEFLSSLGFVESKSACEKFGSAYVCHLKRGARFELVISIAPLSGYGFPKIVNIYVMPALYSVISAAPLAGAVRRGDFFSLLLPVIPNLGAYRVAETETQLGAILYANEDAVRTIVPHMISRLNDMYG